RRRRSDSPRRVSSPLNAPPSSDDECARGGQAGGNERGRDRPSRRCGGGAETPVASGNASQRLGRSRARGKLIIRWSLVRIQAGPTLWATLRAPPLAPRGNPVSRVSPSLCARFARLRGELRGKFAS